VKAEQNLPAVPTT